ncbi:MAG: hypothetical protein ACKVKM_00900, partial [Verrucomicrobiia bacterium]
PNHAASAVIHTNRIAAIKPPHSQTAKPKLLKSREKPHPQKTTKTPLTNYVYVLSYTYAYDITACALVF